MKAKSWSKKMLFSISLLAVSSWGVDGAQGADFENDLNSEVNSFQVQLKPARRASPPRMNVARAKTPKKQQNQELTNNRKFRVSTEPEETILAAAKPTGNQEPLSVYHSPDFDQNQSPGFLLRLNAIPQMAFSTYDGADLNTVVPQSMTEAVKSGISGTITADFNLFGSQEFVLESGVSFLQLGSGTGQNQYSFFNGQMVSYYDTVSNSYIGVPVLIKWLFSGENTSSLYVKGGASPLFMMNDSYNNRGNLTLGAYRFGGLNKFDVAINLGVGYSLKVGEQFHVLIDVTGYQGLLPVMSNFNVYNAAITTGLGVGYSF